MKPEYSEEFKFWYERFFLQSPSLCKLEFDDEKMYAAWKACETRFEQKLKEKNK
jgi:hypothetical protein